MAGGMTESPSVRTGPLREHSGAAVASRVWGLEAIEIHDAYWASMGVACVRTGSGVAPDAGADVFLLLEADQLVVFDLREIAETLLWNGADVTRVEVVEPTSDGYRERIRFAADGGVEKIERRYTAERRVSAKVLVAQRRSFARAWAASGRASDALAAMRGHGRLRIDTVDCPGLRFDASVEGDRVRSIEAIARVWAHPERVIAGIRPLADGVFGLEGDALRADDRCVGPLWIGSHGHDGPRQEIGPAVLWDEDGQAAAGSAVRVRPISEVFSPEYARSSREPSAQGDWYDPVKRLADFTMALVALLAFSPLILAIAVAVWLDDGFPIFFGHRRQARGGRTFRCWKFRTMRRDAESLVAQLRRLNLCDGPQVFIKDDPRVTRVGRILRRMQLDELPQFWNVLVGDMSVVGPRPSPENENQFCPAWREKRLSVRPGITGLWQVMRTRAPGKDFQEWIQYDIEYVERKSPWLDLRIVVLTALGVLGIGRRGGRQEEAGGTDAPAKTEQGRNA